VFWSEPAIRPRQSHRRGQVGERIRGVDFGGALRAHCGHRHAVSAKAAVSERFERRGRPCPYYAHRATGGSEGTVERSERDRELDAGARGR